MTNNKYEIALETLIERKVELLKELEGLEYIINSLKLKSGSIIYGKEHINKGEIFKCDLCNNKYKSKDSLNRHIKLNHKPDASTDNNSQCDTPYNVRELPQSLNYDLYVGNSYNRQGNDLAHRNNV